MQDAKQGAKPSRDIVIKIRLDFCLLRSQKGASQANKWGGHIGKTCSQYGLIQRDSWSGGRVYWAQLFFDTKPTRLTHLLSFASLFDDNVQELYDLSNTLATPMQSQCNLFSLDVFKDELPEVPTRTWSRSEKYVLHCVLNMCF